MLQEIKRYASARFLMDTAEELELHHSVIHLDYDPLLKDKLSELLPKHIVTGRVDDIVTIAEEEESGQYYPEHSYYRLSIIYSGRVDQLSYFKNWTVHYDRDMKFISLQGHNANDVEELSVSLEELFSNLKTSDEVLTKSDILCKLAEELGLPVQNRKLSEVNIEDLLLTENFLLDIKD